MGVLIDTSVFVAWERRELVDAAERWIGDEERGISVITLSELLYGVHRARGAVRQRRRAFAEYVIAMFDPVPITHPVARLHAEVRAELAARGSLIGAHDLWIAATAVTYGFGVLTMNVRDFRRVPGLRVVEAAA